MDTNDTTSDDVIVYTPDQFEDQSFGKEVAKTLVVSTATSAGVFGAFIVTALVVPKIVTWFNRKKNTDVIEGESSVKDTSEEK